jgi:hypothetical protein
VLSWLKIFFKNMLGFTNDVNRQFSSAHARNSTTRASPPAITGLPVKTSGVALGSLAACRTVSRPNKDIHSLEL